MSVFGNQDKINAGSRVFPENYAGRFDQSLAYADRKEIKTEDYLLYAINRRLFEIRTSPFTDQINHAGKVNEVTFSRCGQYLASGSNDKFLKVWNVLENREILCSMFKDSVNSVSFSFDSSCVAAGSDAKITIVIDLKTKEEVEFQNQSKVLVVRFSPKSFYLAIGNETGEVIILNIKSKEEYLKLWHPYDPKSVVLMSNSNEVKSRRSKEEENLLPKGIKTDINPLDSRSEKDIENYKSSEYNQQKIKNPVKTLTFSASGMLAAFVSDEIFVKIWSLSTITEVFNLSNDFPVFSVSFSKDDSKLAVASGGIKIWDLKDNERPTFIYKFKSSIHYDQFNLSPNDNEINSVFFSDDDKYLVSVCKDNIIKVWKYDSFKQKFIGKNSHKINSVSLSVDCNFLASGSLDNTVKVWNIREQQSEFYGIHLDTVRAVSFSPDSQLLATGSDDCTVRIWNISKNQEILQGKHRGPVYCVQFSCSGNFLASGSYDNFAIVWDVRNLKHDQKARPLQQLMKIEHLDTVNSVKISPNDKFLLSGSYGGDVKLNEISEEGEENLEEFKEVNLFPESKEKNIKGNKGNKSNKGRGLSRNQNFRNHKESVHEYQHSGPVFSVDFSSNEELMASGSFDQRIIILKMANLQLPPLEIEANCKITSILFSPNSKYLASSSYDKNIVQVWNLKSIWSQKIEAESIQESKLKRNPEGDNYERKKVKQKEFFVVQHSDTVNSLSFSKSNNLLASGSSDSTVKVWNIKEKQELFSGKHSAAVNSVAFANDGKYLATGSNDNTVKIWSIDKKGEEFVFSHSDTVNAVAFSDDGNLLASGSFDKTVKVWKIRGNDSLDRNKDHSKSVNTVAFSSDSNLIASGSDDNTIRLWYVPSMDFKILFENEAIGIIVSLAFSNDCKYFACGTENNKLKLWSLDRNIEIPLNGEHSDTVNSVSFSSDCKCLASASFDRTVRIWDLINTENKPIIINYSAKVTVLTFSPDSKFLATGSYDQKVKVWDVSSIDSSFQGDASSSQNKKQKHPFSRLFRGSHAGPVTSLSCSLDSKFLVSASYDNTLRVWDISGQRQHFIGYHSDTVNSVVISPNIDLVASGSDDKKVKVWSISSGREEFTGGHSGSVLTLDFSPSGDYLASGSYDNSVKIWNIKEKREEFRFEHKDTVRSVCFARNGMYFASGSDDCHVNICKINKKPNSFDNIGVGEPDKPPDAFEKYRIEEGKFGFEVKSRDYEKVRKLKIIRVAPEEFQFLIGADEFTSKPPKMNQLYKDIIKYQDYLKKIVEIDTDIIQSDIFIYRPHKVVNSFDAYEVHLKSALNAIYQNNLISALPTCSEILISESKYTLIHFASFLGDSKALERLLNDFDEKIEMKSDIFGKSPLFYSIKKKHQSSADVVLEYLINFESEDVFKLISNLNSTRNDFLLIIENSSTKLPGFLSKLLLKAGKPVKVPESFRLPVTELSDNCTPDLRDFQNLSEEENDDNKITGIIKYTPFEIPIHPFSVRNIEALKVILKCSNKEIYNEVLIQYFIDYNWKAASKWAIAHSFIIWTHILLYCFTLIDMHNRYILIPFWITYCMISFWEIMQFRSNLGFYFTDPWNYIDVLMILWTPVWSFFRISKIDLLYSDLVMGFLLMIRGIASFKVIDGTRDYVHLILQSMKSMIYFLIIFIYSSIFFSLFLFIVLVNDESQNFSYYEILRISWAISTGGDNGTESQNSIIFLVIFISIIFNLILMLNMLISILGDSYEKFCIEKNTIDYREKIHLSLEIQNALFSSTLHKDSHYLHILSNQFENETENDKDWQGRLLFSEQRQDLRIQTLGTEISGLARAHKNSEEVQKRIDYKIEGMEKKINEIQFDIAKILDLHNNLA